jgi:hypothetical protein
MHEGTRLRGPADPTQFRVKVGYYRHYHDPLPACDIAPETDATWPAVSSIKNAAGKDWSYVSLGRAAEWLVDNHQTLVGKAKKEIYNQLVAINKSGLEQAQDRGTDVHALLEARGMSRTHTLSPDAAPYEGVVDQFLQDCQPEFLLSEVVVINRTLGYGGTGDAWCVINHPKLGRVLADWKTRSDADKHAAYPEECWQVGGAYFHGEYLIVEENGQAVRRPMLELDGAVIVSLAPEGYQVIPIDVEASWETFQALYGFWSKKQGRSFAGKPVHVARGGTIPEPTGSWLRAEQLRNRIAKLTEAQRTALKAQWPKGISLKREVTPEESGVVLNLIRQFENAADWVREMVKAAPDEGRAVDPQTIAALERKYEALSDDDKSWIKELAVDAHRAGAGLRLKDQPSLRRFELMRALVSLCGYCVLGHNGLLASLIAATIGDVPGSPGALLASMDADTAAHFARHVDALVAGVEDDTPHLKPVA